MGGKTQSSSEDALQAPIFHKIVRDKGRPPDQARLSIVHTSSYEGARLVRFFSAGKYLLPGRTESCPIGFSNRGNIMLFKPGFAGLLRHQSTAVPNYRMWHASCYCRRE